MKYTPGAVLTEGAGSIGGVTASKNHSGGFFRSRTTPVNPRTVSQLSQRSKMQIISQNWRLTPGGARNAWIALATQFPRLNSLNKTYYLTGQQMYMFCQLNVWSCVYGSFIACPNISQNNISPFSSWAVIYPGQQPPYYLYFNFTPVIGGNQKCILQSTGSVSRGKKYQQNWKTIGVYDALTISGVDIKDDYALIFGNYITLNDMAWFRCWLVDFTTGFRSTKQTNPVISA
jgi:hypothetical protein